MAKNPPFGARPATGPAADPPVEESAYDRDAQDEHDFPRSRGRQKHFPSRNAGDVPPAPGGESTDETGVEADADAGVGVDDAGGAVTAPADNGADEEPPAELLILPAVRL